mmetsp:Transcript_63256/g.137976  ORF Transcript_63256/g.137976 Transcript_63256/m.137976 type:complete len:283 (+) Transcript_63256:1-849(+)
MLSPRTIRSIKVTPRHLKFASATCDPITMSGPISTSSDCRHCIKTRQLGGKRCLALERSNKLGWRLRARRQFTLVESYIFCDRSGRSGASQSQNLRAVRARKGQLMLPPSQATTCRITQFEHIVVNFLRHDRLIVQHLDTSRECATCRALLAGVVVHRAERSSTGHSQWKQCCSVTGSCSVRGGMRVLVQGLQTPPGGKRECQTIGDSALLSNWLRHRGPGIFRGGGAAAALVAAVVHVDDEVVAADGFDLEDFVAIAVVAHGLGSQDNGLRSLGPRVQLQA